MGRKSEIIKTSSGRRIAPLKVEAHFQKLPEVDRAVVFGDGRSGLVGLLALSTPATDDLKQRLRRELAQLNRALPSYERVWAWSVLDRPPSVENGEITLNHKLRRSVIQNRCRVLLEELFKAAARHLRERTPDGPDEAIVW